MKLIHLPLTTSLLMIASLLHAGPITQGAPGAVPPESFSIMSDHEIAEHQATMASLQGTAREEYRNAQYEKLKQRAQAQGYQLPDTPPWGNTEVVPASVPETPAKDVNDMMDALIAQQKQVVQQAIQAAETSVPAAQQAASAPPKSAAVGDGLPPAKPPTVQDPPADTTPVADASKTIPPATTALQSPATTMAQAEKALSEQKSAEKDGAMEAYREQMRNRFDNFMQQREERQQARQAERQRDQAEIEARRKEYKERVEARRQAARQRQAPTMQQPQPVPQQPYQQGYAPFYPPYYAPYGYPAPGGYPPPR